MPRAIGSQTDGAARAASISAKRGTGAEASIVDWVTGLQGRLSAVEDKFYEMGYDMKRVAQSEVKKRWKVQPQAETFFGMYTALVCDTLDAWKQGRVRMYSPLLNHPDMPVKSLDWAWPISSFGGFDDAGSPWVPPVGSTLCVIFERGSKSTPYYLGTAWSRDKNWEYPIPEYECIHKGHREGYLIGPGTDIQNQSLPPWNTESYHGPDPDQEANQLEIEGLPITYPNIMGMKTPGKHMTKYVDGDYLCNHRWKRLEVMSGSGGGWMMFKDDHMHPSGQWSHPDCNCECGGGDVTNCATCNPKLLCCEAAPPEPCGGGSQDECANLYFKHENECRPYKGPRTPQNNKANLPQTGIQFLTYSGHSFLMDDKVEQPQGIPEWERSLAPFDWGCTNKYQGRARWQSTTGHFIELNDWEEPEEVRSQYNWVKLMSACGNKVELNDHTVPECIAGDKRGIWLQSTSNHVIQMCDDGTEQCSPRKEINPEEKCIQGFQPGKGEPAPVPKAKRGYIRLRTGYGLEIMMADSFSQEKTEQQYIQIFCPQKDNEDCGPHIMRFQEVPAGCGYVYLRVGGDYICSTCCDHVTIVGDKDGFKPSTKVVMVSKDYIEVTEDIYYNEAQNHIFFAEEHIFLLADHDCPDGNPCAGLVAVFTSGGLKASTRVFASFRPSDPVVPIWALYPFMSSDGNE